MQRFNREAIRGMLGLAGQEIGPGGVREKLQQFVDLTTGIAQRRDAIVQAQLADQERRQTEIDRLRSHVAEQREELDKRYRRS